MCDSPLNFNYKAQGSVLICKYEGVYKSLNQQNFVCINMNRVDPKFYRYQYFYI